MHKLELQFSNLHDLHKAVAAMANAQTGTTIAGPLPSREDSATATSREDSATATTAMKTAELKTTSGSATVDAATEPAKPARKTTKKRVTKKKAASVVVEPTPVEEAPPLPPTPVEEALSKGAVMDKFRIYMAKHKVSGAHKLLKAFNVDRFNEIPEASYHEFMAAMEKGL